MMVKMIMMMMMRCCAARPYFSGFTYALKLQMCNWCPEPNARATLSSLSRTRQLEELHHSESALRKENQEIRGVGAFQRQVFFFLQSQIALVHGLGHSFRLKPGSKSFHRFDPRCVVNLQYASSRNEVSNRERIEAT